MKDKILEIINDGLNAHNQSMPSLITRESIANEINFLTHKHYMKFVEWAGEDYMKASKVWIPIYSDARNQSNWKTTEQLYQYWCEKILDK